MPALLRQIRRHLAYNYLGGNIGGPIKKGQTVFLADYLKFSTTKRTPTPSEYQRRRSAQGSKRSTTAIYNPFSGNSDGTGRQQIVASSSPGVTTVPGATGPVDAYNPACTNAGGCPNIIPSAMINPISTALLNFVPAPNNGTGNTNNYFALLPFHKDTDFVDAKIDAYLSAKDRLSGRFSYQRPSVFQAADLWSWRRSRAGQLEGQGIQNTYSIGLTTTTFSLTRSSPSPRGASWYHNEAHNTDFGTNTSDSLGIPGVNLDAITSGIVGIQINGGVYSNPLIGFPRACPGFARKRTSTWRIPGRRQSEITP